MKQDDFEWKLGDRIQETIYAILKEVGCPKPDPTEVRIRHAVVELLPGWTWIEDETDEKQLPLEEQLVIIQIPDFPPVLGEMIRNDQGYPMWYSDSFDVGATARPFSQCTMRYTHWHPMPFGPIQNEHWESWRKANGYTS